MSRIPLLPAAPLRLAEPTASVREYVAAGGGGGLAAALRAPAEAVAAEVARSGLRGRGGAGFPTGAKWQAVRADPCLTRYLVCNAAEGEPGTFKARWILRRNPYQVLEGMAIAAYAIGASASFIAINGGFTREIGTLRRAMREMAAAGMTGPVPVHITPGPSGPAHPTVTNNVETLANLPAILRDGAEVFRSTGTGASPGTMIFTVCGDVNRPGLYQLPLGTPLLSLLAMAGGSARAGHRIKAVFPGASNAILTTAEFGTPLDFDAMRSVGSGLGAGGFIAYDHSACIVAATLAFSRFLAAEACGQCPACQGGTREITGCLERIEAGTGSGRDIDGALARCTSVSAGRRCALLAGAALLVASAIGKFRAEFDVHLGGGCPRPRDLPVPILADFDQGAARFRYQDQDQERDRRRGSSREVRGAASPGQSQ